MGRGRLRNVVNTLRGKPEASVPKDRREGESLEDAALADVVGERRTYKEKGDEATVTLVTAKVVKTLDDLLDACEMDGQEWEVLDWEASAWNSPVKKDTIITEGEEAPKTYKVSEPQIVQLHRVKARFRRKVYEPAIREYGDRMIERIANAGRYVPPAPEPIEGGHLVVLSLPDTHIGKLVDPVLTGDSYTITDALSLHAEAVRYLLDAAGGSYDIERVLAWVGNDALQVDGQKGQTTAGTQVESVGTWFDQFEAAEMAYMDLIDASRLVAPTDAIVVLGNHAEHSEFALGRVLNAAYRDDPHVRIDAGREMRKYYRYGDVLLGGTHGKENKPASLPGLMAGEAKEWWAECSYYEFHVGHLHHRRRSHPGYPGDYEEVDGVLVRMSPALCPPDPWHERGGWISALRAAEAHVYHRQRGHVASFRFHVPKAKPSRVRLAA